MQPRKTNCNEQIVFWGVWGSLTLFGGLFVLLTNLGITFAMIAGGFFILTGLLFCIWQFILKNRLSSQYIRAGIVASKV